MKSFFLNVSRAPDPVGNSATGITNIHGATPAGTYNSDWTVTNLDEGQTTNDVSSIWSSSTGAQICYRYEDGVLTSTPLWPWPMHQRIYDALQTAGYRPFCVTEKMEEFFGPISAQCRTSTPTAPPLPQTNLRLVF